jgi:hypothetical protein
LQGQGVFRAATDGKAAYQRIDGGTYDAFYENAGPDIDPEGRGLCLFSIQGSTIETTCAMTRDGGKSWDALTTDPESFGYDVGAGDWSEGGKTILAKRHHNGGLVLSHDRGRTWTVLAAREPRVVALGLIGPHILLKGIAFHNALEPSGLFRSTDDGANWTHVAPCGFNRIGHVVVLHGSAYLTCNEGLLASHDKGVSWRLHGGVLHGMLGPVMFDKVENHQVIYGMDGFFETKDGGITWSLAVRFGDDPAMRSGRFEYGIWDPHTDTFYLTHISGKTYGFRR